MKKGLNGLKLLREIIRSKEQDIIREWHEALLTTYPADSVPFIKGQKSQFANPIGHIFQKGLQETFPAIVYSNDNEAVRDGLDEIVRVRAVQDFSPAGALAFLFDLKGIIRAYCEEAIHQNGLLSELWRLDARIDESALIAFNIYVSCKQEIADIRVNEVKSNVAFLLRRANMLVDDPPV